MNYSFFLPILPRPALDGGTISLARRSTAAFRTFRPAKADELGGALTGLQENDHCREKESPANRPRAGAGFLDFPYRTSNGRSPSLVTIVVGGRLSAGQPLSVSFGNFIKKLMRNRGRLITEEKCLDSRIYALVNEDAHSKIWSLAKSRTARTCFRVVDG